MTDGQDPPSTAPAVELKRGDLVTIEGLKSEELNGAQATLFRFDQESGRWEVKMSDGEVKAIRPVNLAFRGIGPLEDDGSLMLIGMASDNATLQKALGNLGDLQGPSSEALALLGTVISPAGGGKVEGEDARLWLKLAKQAEQQVRGCLEDFQKSMEMVDGIEMHRIGAKAAGELKLARRDLIQNVQKSQEQMEAGLARLRPQLKRLTATVPELGKKQRWATDEQPIQEKYRAAFEKLEESVEQTTRKTRLSTITVKYQGPGSSPPASDNLYIKGLPGWVTEAMVEAIFKQAGDIQSMKLKTADWGAIAFIRLANRAEAARAIAKFNGTVPQILEKKAEEKETEKLEDEIAKAALRATVDQLARGVIVVVDLRQPLGIIFDDNLKATSVQDDGQAFGLGVRRGWRVRSIGGHDLAKTDALKERMAKMKAEGFKQGALVCTPPPVMASLTERNCIVLEKDPDLGLIFVADSKGSAKSQGIRRGAIVGSIGGVDVSSSSTPEDVMNILKEALLPVTAVFEQAQAGALGQGVINLEDEALPAELPPPVDLDVDLSQPLGIMFDDNLVAKTIKFSSQAAGLGVEVGWKVLSISGEELSSTAELLQKVQKLKDEGSLSQSITFQPTAGSRSAPVTAQAAAKYLRERNAHLSAELAEQEKLSTRRVEVELDLSQPLGILFNKSLLVESVQDGSQSAKLGIAGGWRAVSIAGEEFANTKDLVAKIQALKQEGIASATAVFNAPLLEIKATETTKRKAPEEVTREVTLDLAQPLGIGFGDRLMAKDVKEGGQGANLGVCPGWRLISVAGEKLAQTKDLVAKIQSLKSEGKTSVSSSWSCPSSASEEKELEVSLMEPLGIGFTDSLVAKEVKPGSQAERLGVGLGWQVTRVAGDQLAATKELVAKFQGLKKSGASSVRVVFAVPGDAAEAKRQRTD